MNSEVFEPLKLVIVMREDLNMPSGKIAAQSAHATRGAIHDTTASSELRFRDNPWLQPWLTNGLSRTIVLGAKSEAKLLAVLQQAQEAGLPVFLVEDLGLTVFEGVRTKTAISIGPAPDALIDQVTRRLRLLKEPVVAPTASSPPANTPAATSGAAFVAAPIEVQGED